MGRSVMGYVQEWEDITKKDITFSYPSLSMRTPSKLNWRAEKYERIGSENPTVGIASSWQV